jgi:hypothetical protein
MPTMNRPSTGGRIRAALAAGALLLAGAVPAAANVNFGSCTVEDGVAWACSGSGGKLTCDSGVAYCCKSSGKGKDFVRICDQLDQVIDLFQVPPTTTTTLPSWRLGYPLSPVLRQ